MKKPNMKPSQQQSVPLKYLRKADKSFAVPFNLILADGSLLVCEEVVRVIPGKRLVAFGLWNERPVVAKLFYERGSANRHYEREVKGTEILHAANIPSPKLFTVTTGQEKKIYVLLFERILEAKSLEDIRCNAPKKMFAYLHAMTLELATQHVMGVVQQDLHLGNFLVAKNKIYTLDGGSVCSEGAILSKKQSLHYLALFFAQLGVGTEALQNKLFDTYVKSRGWIVRKADVDILQKEILNWNKTRWGRFKQKIVRQCTAFNRIQTLTSLTLYDRDFCTGEFVSLIKDPEPFFSKSSTESLKAGGSSTVVKVSLSQQDLVVKRYNLKTIWHWLRRCLRPSRAAKSWELAHKLHLFGIETAKPVAFIEHRFLGLRGRSYFVMEAVQGPHLGEYFIQHRDNDVAITQMAERVVALLKNLAKLNLTHGDLKMTNILVKNDCPVLIDLDGMVEHKTWFGLHRAWRKEMKRFMKNWENMPSVKKIFEQMISH